MPRPSALILLLPLLSAEVLFAEAPTASLFPVPRPVPALVTPESSSTETTTAIPAYASDSAPDSASSRPEPRPGIVKPKVDVQSAPATASSPAAAPGTPPAVAASLRPKARPGDLSMTTASVPQAPVKGKGKKSAKGSVCGDPDIRGEALAPIKSKTKGCGLAEPAKVSMINNVTLNPAATISCDTAAAVKQWIEQGVDPAFGRREVVELKVAASYICRTRNNKKGARVSEHGRGNAIDIAGFVMSDGTTWTIERDYNKTIRKAHKSACGIFGTTLGPGSDGYHEDHLHFDIARYSGGSYCR